MKRSFLMMGMALTFVSQGVRADEGNVNNRCKDDQIASAAEGIARNEWALKCRYIDAEDRDYFNRKGRYAVFTNYNAPRDANAPCVSGLAMLADCHIGCFTASQRVMFGGHYEPIAQASALKKSTLTTLSTESRPGHLAFAEEEIEYFVAGETTQDILVLAVQNGSKLEVTPNHPMVDSAGRVLRADAVKVGDSLLTMAGPSTVTGVTAQAYNGKVWNVRPVSDKARANINIAEGFLTGSIRFQNEWSDQDHRLMLRKKLDITGL